MSGWRLDGGDRRDIAHRLYLSRLGGKQREEFDAHAPEDVAALLEEIDDLSDAVETMVPKAEYEEQEKEAAEARADVEAYEKGVRLVFVAMSAEPRVLAVLVAGQDEEERASLLAVLLGVVPLVEMLREMGASAERAAAGRERANRLRARERERLVSSYMARTKVWIAEALVAETGLPPLSPEQRAIKTSELLASRDAQKAEMGASLAKLTKHDLAWTLALLRTRIDHERGV